MACCDSRRWLVASIGSLTCGLEAGHQGTHLDKDEGVRWSAVSSRVSGEEKP